MKEKFFWAVRHGFALHNLAKAVTGGDVPDADPALVEFGRQQALLSGQKMKELGHIKDIRHVVCSPSDRTLETAQLFLEAAGFKGTVIVDPRLASRMDTHPVNCGALSKAELIEKYVTNNKSPVKFDFSGLPEGNWWPAKEETAEAFAHRVKDFAVHYFRRLKFKPENTLVITHDGWIKAYNGIAPYDNVAIGKMSVLGEGGSVVYAPPAPTPEECKAAWKKIKGPQP